MYDDHFYCDTCGWHFIKCYCVTASQRALEPGCPEEVSEFPPYGLCRDESHDE